MDLEERDPNANHVSVHSTFLGKGSKDGVSAFEVDDSLISLLSSSLRSGEMLTAQVSYATEKQELSVFVDNMVKPLLRVNVGKLEGRLPCWFCRENIMR